MADGHTDRRIFQLFAELLDYPQPGLLETVREGQTLVGARSGEAASLLGAFGAFVEETPLGRLEEVYTGTFELNAIRHPYVGHHLFGESYKRSIFLLGLKERYKAHGFTVEKELPDHLGVVLRFLAACDDTDLTGELISEALLPTLEGMVGESDQSEPRSQDGEQQGQGIGGEPYRQVLQALQLALQSLWTNASPSAANDQQTAESVEA